VVQKDPGKAELGAEVFGQRPDAKRLGRVMPAEVDVQSELLGVEVAVVRAFTGNVGVESLHSGLLDERSTGSRHDPHATDSGRAEQHGLGRGPEGLGETLGEAVPIATSLPPDPDGLILPRSKITSYRNTESARQQRGVPDVGMTIQREMCPVDGDTVTNQPCNPLEPGADYRPEATPEQAMMNEEKIGLLFGRHPYGRGAQIDRGGYSSDGSSIPDLQTVERFGIVVDGVDSQVLVAVVNDIEEVHVRERFS